MLIELKKRLKEHEKSLKDMIDINNILLTKDPDEIKINKINEIFKEEIESGHYAKVTGENIVNYPQSCWYPKDRKLAKDKTYFRKESIISEMQNIESIKEKIKKVIDKNLE